MKKVTVISYVYVVKDNYLNVLIVKIYYFKTWIFNIISYIMNFLMFRKLKKITKGVYVHDYEPYIIVPFLVTMFLLFIFSLEMFILTFNLTWLFTTVISFLFIVFCIEYMVKRDSKDKLTIDILKNNVLCIPFEIYEKLWPCLTQKIKNSIYKLAQDEILQKTVLLIAEKRLNREDFEKLTQQIKLLNNIAKSVNERNSEIIIETFRKIACF